MGLELVGKVSLDGSGFHAGLLGMKEGAKEFASEMKNMVFQAFGVAAIGEMIRKTTELGEQIVNSAARIGISTDAFQTMGHAVQMTGADIEDLTKFVEKLNAARVDPKKIDFIKHLGVSEDKLGGPVEDLVREISRIARTKSAQELGPDLLHITGQRMGGRFMNFLRSDLEALEEEARKLGLVINTQDLASLKLLADETKILSRTLTAELAPAIALLGKVVMSVINILRSTGTFFGSLFGSGAFTPRNVVALLDDMVKGRQPNEVHQETKKLLGAITTAGDASMKEFREGSDRIEKRRAEIVKGTTPEETPPEMPKVKEKHERVATDSLLKVGNFLGSSTDSLTRIYQKQIHILEKIEMNTRSKVYPVLHESAVSHH